MMQGPAADAGRADIRAGRRGPRAHDPHLQGGSSVDKRLQEPGRAQGKTQEMAA